MLLRTSFIFRFNFLQIARTFSSAPPQNATVQSVVSKESLMKMRKTTGYSYVRCRKALAKFGEDNFEQAEKWLKEMAIKEGWAKAAKLSSREAHQGLCAVITDKNIGALIELNCETDFVAKSEDFRTLLEKITVSLLKQGNQLKTQQNIESNKFTTFNLDTKDIKILNDLSGEEAIVSMVGKLGENITLSRATLFFAKPEISIVGHAHPIEQFGQIKLGRFVSLVGIHRSEENSGFPTEKLANQICQHIIGMLPEKLGEPFSVEEVKNKEKLLEEDAQKGLEEASNTPQDEEAELNSFTKVESLKIDEDETSLLRQSFMLNPSVSVHQYLAGHGAEITDFVRVELGKKV